jgi:hypothetical protein
VSIFREVRGKSIGGDLDINGEGSKQRRFKPVLDILLESIPLAWLKEIASQMARADPGASTKCSRNVSSTKIAGPYISWFSPY